jgi:hypothetical protein
VDKVKFKVSTPTNSIVGANVGVIRDPHITIKIKYLQDLF